MISAVIFDMDGLLVGSEPLWREAEVEVFRTAGVPLDETMCLETTGLRIDQVVEHWDRRFGLSGKSHRELREAILSRVAALIGERALPLPGAIDAVTYAAERLPAALASSSPHAIIDAVLLRLGVRGRFRVVHSADEEAFGKPHPAVFLETARRLGVLPVECLVFEDSLNGVLAAKAARMRCVAVPEDATKGDPRFVIADRVLADLTRLDGETWAELLA
jgi:sugar-phosphatase